MDIRFILACDSAGRRRMEVFFCTDLPPIPVQILQWVIMGWSVAVTCDDGQRFASRSCKMPCRGTLTQLGRLLSS
jgi:hypothetical protein